MSLRPTSTLELPSPRLLSSKPSPFFRSQYEIDSPYKRAISSVIGVILPAVNSRVKLNPPRNLSTKYGPFLKCVQDSLLSPKRGPSLQEVRLMP